MAKMLFVGKELCTQVNEGDWGSHILDGDDVWSIIKSNVVESMANKIRVMNTIINSSKGVNRQGISFW